MFAHQKDDATAAAVVEAIERATGAKKCHPCGCFHDAVVSLDQTSLRGDLADTLAEARSTFGERKYDCLGCGVCWPANALDIAADLAELPASAGCRTDLPERREGWPPMPGEFEVVRYAAPVAVCTLHSRELIGGLLEACPGGLSIIGAMQTENLGIERLIENVVANPNLRAVLVCGEDTAGRVGHFPGQTLLALAEHGVDGRGRIIGASGRRPVLKNISRELVEHFRDHVRVLDHRGELDLPTLASAIELTAAAALGPVEAGPPGGDAIARVVASPPDRLVLDPAGYVVVTPDRRRGLLVAEHYENRGVLTAVVEGGRAVDVVATLLVRGLVTRTDHAAYLGRELALAERAMVDGATYVQDRAPGGEPAAPEAGGADPCCADSCGGN